MSGFRDHCDDGGPDVRVLKSQRVKALNDCLCDLCGKIIPKHSTYHSSASLVDGKFEYLRAHDGAGLCAVAAEPPDPYEDFEDLTGRAPTPLSEPKEGR